MTLSSTYSDYSLRLLKGYYLDKDETSPEEAFRRTCRHFSYGDKVMEEFLYDAVCKGHFMFSSPILSNSAKGSWVNGKWVGEIKRGLPISCFLTYPDDSVQGLIDHTAEERWMSISGGGVGGHWSDIRGVSEKSPGIIPFLKTVDADMTAYRQGKTRKGSYAAYLDISHPDIVEFISMRKATGGDSDRKCFNLHNAINISDKFMLAVDDGSDWDLVCPHSGEVKDTVSARGLWESILETRFITGEPYMNFIDTANKALPDYLKALGLKINGSNLCNEIHLPTNKDRSAVCCLLSVNLEKYLEWKDTALVEMLTRFLDNVMQWFIDHAPKEMHKAIFGAESERPLGIGAMGFHSLLQRLRIPFESAGAASLNRKIFREIKRNALLATAGMAVTRGEPADLKGTGRRNSHLLAIAPNANSSIILNTSPSIELWQSNAFVQRTRAGSNMLRNKYLHEEIVKHAEEKQYPDAWVESQWLLIEADKGSAQNLVWLSDYMKDVFKAAFEVDQHWVVQHAADRQVDLCQGQSVNVFFPYGSERSYVSSVHRAAHRLGMKGLYYLRTESARKGDNVSTKIERVALKDADCIACEG